MAKPLWVRIEYVALHEEEPADIDTILFQTDSVRWPKYYTEYYSPTQSTLYLEIKISGYSFEEPTPEHLEVTFTLPDGKQEKFVGGWHEHYLGVPDDFVIPSENNEVPIAGYFVSIAEPGKANTIKILDHASDPDGDPLTVTIAQAPTKGTAVVNPDGTISYTPKDRLTTADAQDNDAIWDELTYRVDDGRGGVATAKVAIEIDVPTITILGPTRIAEGDSGTSNMRFVVALSARSEQDITIHYRTQDVTTRPGDIVHQSGSLTIRAGEAGGEIFVPVTGNTEEDGDRRFELVLHDPINALLPRLGGKAVISQPYSGLILDDDGGVAIDLGDPIAIPDLASAEERAEIVSTLETLLDVLETAVTYDSGIQDTFEAAGKATGDLVTVARIQKNIEALKLVEGLLAIARSAQIIGDAYRQEDTDPAAWGDATQNLLVLLGSSLAGRAAGAVIIATLSPAIGTIGAVAIAAGVTVLAADTIEDRIGAFVRSVNTSLFSSTDDGFDDDWHSGAASGMSRSPFGMDVGQELPEPAWEYDAATKKVVWLTPITPEIRMHLDATAARMGIPIAAPVGFTIEGDGNAADPQAVLVGGSGDDVVSGGGGNDGLAGRQGDDRIIGRTGNDVLFGGDGDDTLAGGGGNDTLIGGHGKDLLLGGAGKDLLEGGAGADLLKGGPGNDTASYASSNAGVSVNLATGVGVGGHARGDTLITIENLIGSRFNDTLAGNSEPNHLQGGAGDDVLVGGGGNDRLFGESGVDVLRGGAGNDVLFGGDGHDKLFGGAGDDHLHGGAGFDYFDGGSGVDTIYYIGRVTVDMVKGKVTWFGETWEELFVNVENVVTGPEHDVVIGDGGPNRITLGAGNDVADGGGGDDVLVGGGGDDELIGGSGNDKLFGGGGDDVLLGGGGDDRLYGGPGNDRLVGGTGNDVLVAGPGRDVLTGGLGADRFVYTKAAHIGTGAGRDVIRDFKPGIDLLDLAGIDANTQLPGNQAFSFIGAAAFTQAGQLRYDDGMLSGDVNGNGQADFELRFANSALLSSDDILV